MYRSAHISLFLLSSLILLSQASAKNPLEWLFGERNAELFDRGRQKSDRDRGYDFRATGRGNGNLVFRGRDHDLEAATVNLTRDGRAEFVFDGDQDLRLAGTWQRGKANKALITITHAHGRAPATGNGTLTFTEDSFARITFKGRSQGLGGAFRLNFQVRRVQDHRERQQISIDATRRGRGYLAIDGTNKRLSQARVILQRDGDARIILNGHQSYAFTGAWSRRGEKIFDLRITRGPNKRRMNAAGSVTVADRGFSRITLLDDPPRGDRIRLSFDASDRDHVDRRNRYRGTDAELRGRGTMTSRKRNIRLTRGSVALYPDGNAILTFQSERRHVLEATWFGCQDANTLELEIDRYNDRPAEGTGKLILHDNREVHAVECEGRADASNGNFRIVYRPAGHDEDPRFEQGNDPIAHDHHRPRGRTINTTEYGIGRYESRASNANVNQAKIQLGANGGASLAFSGRSTYSFTGSWVFVREGIAQVDITRMQGRIAVTGRATVQYRGDRVTSVQVSGSSRQRGGFQLSFRSGRGSR